MARATENNPAPAPGEATAAACAAPAEPERRVAQPLLLNAGQAAALCGVSRRTWWALHSAGKTPLAVRLGRRTLWRAAGPGGLEAWVAAGCPARDRWEPTRGARR
jgi:predicted DNA-binding transcriptional regulator AlpA